MASSPEEHHFHQHDAIKSGIKGSLFGGGAGLITSAVQNSLAKRNVGAMGVFTRTGGTVAMFSTSLPDPIGEPTVLEEKSSTSCSEIDRLIVKTAFL